MDDTNMTLSTEEFRQKITDITGRDYQQFFDRFDSLISQIEQKVESPAVEKIILRIEDIQSEIKQIFYKEKLILFPFLEKSYAEDDFIKSPVSVSQVAEQTEAVLKKIRHFGSDFKNLDSGLSEQEHFQIKNQIDELSKCWDLICEQKNKLFDSFHLKKVK